MDYMGSSILMGRASGLAVVTKDEWKIRDAGQRRSGYGHREYDLIATRRLVGAVEWGTNVEKLDWPQKHTKFSCSVSVYHEYAVNSLMFVRDLFGKFRNHF